MKTSQELERDLLAENPATAYRQAVDLAVMSTRFGDTAFAEIASEAARNLVAKGYDELPARGPSALADG